MTDKAKAKRFNGYLRTLFEENSSAEREFRYSVCAYAQSGFAIVEATWTQHQRTSRDIYVIRSIVSLDRIDRLAPPLPS